MIYLGDNWPVEYRNHLFTHNLHGHQINHQINLREGGGFNTIHAGYDMLFCADRQFIGVDLMSGPDGAVYLSDWYDPRHCHNPDIDHWDRGNGRIYRMKFDANYRPVRVNLAQATDQELVDAQLHANEWHVRMARLVLSERAANRLISPASVRRLRSLVTDHADPARRLRALWSLHAISAIDLELVSKLINDDSEYVRAWTVQLAVESLPAEKIASMLEGLAEGEPSLFVRRYLASAIQRLPREKGWRIAETLAKQREGADDRELPLLLWYGIAGLMDHDVARALKIAETTPFIALRDYIDWFAAKSSATGRDQLSMRLSEVNGTEQLRLLSLFEFAVRGMRGIHPPKGWDRIANSFYESSDPQLCRTAESLGAAFGDESLFKRMRYQLAGAAADLPTRAHAVSVLSNDSSPENLPHLLRLLDTPQLRRQVLPLLVRYQDQTIAKELLVRLGSWEPVESDAAMEVLTSRTDWATALLDSIDKRDLAPTRLSAYLVRQLLALGDDSIKTRLAKDWGTFGKSSEERKVEIATLVKSYQSAPLWAYSLEAGAAHFKTLCSSCHQETKESESLAPKLEGSGKKGIEYIVENIMDPNAVIGRDFQARVVVTNTGQVVTGLVISDTDTSLTLRTHSNNVTMAKTEIEETRVSENSFMPEGLLKSLNDRERIELLKFLMSR
jgi:putative heme-binding domain-containing protein